MLCAIAGAGVYGTFEGAHADSHITQLLSRAASQAKVAIPAQDGVKGAASSQQSAQELRCHILKVLVYLLCSQNTNVLGKW